MSDIVPRPDPTVLTTEALHREIAALREAVSGEALAARELVEEQFRGVQTQFDLIERANEKLGVADKTALAAALEAQKAAAAQAHASLVAAIEKMESGFTKQIDGVAAKIVSSVATIGGSLDDLRGRLDRGEGTVTGSDKTKSDSRSNVGMIVGIVMAAFGFLSLLITIAVFAMRFGS